MTVARNRTRSSELASGVEVAASLWGKFMGLMGRPTLAQGAGLWLPDSNGIHMMFMRFAIDAVFLDRRRVVVRAAENIRPWQVAFGGFRARSVVELPAGSLRAGDVRVGDELRAEPA